MINIDRWLDFLYADANRFRNDKCDNPFMGRLSGSWFLRPFIVYQLGIIDNLLLPAIVTRYTHHIVNTM